MRVIIAPNTWTRNRRGLLNSWQSGRNRLPTTNLRRKYWIHDNVAVPDWTGYAIRYRVVLGAPFLHVHLVDGTYELFRHYYALPCVRDETAARWLLS